MAWHTEIIPMLRVFIADDVSPYKYSDDRLKTIIAIGGKFVINDLKLISTYTITVNSPSITPDPSLDDVFTTLTSLKSAIIVLSNEAKLKAAGSFSVTDGPFSTNTSAGYTNLENRLKVLISDYTELLFRKSMDSNLNKFVILSTYTEENTNYNSLVY